MGIEPADIEEAGKLWGQQIEDRVAGVRIAPGRHKSSWFVQRDGRGTLEMHELAIDFHMVTLARLRAEISANATVDRHASGRDQLITFSPRTNAGRGEKPI